MARTTHSSKKHAHRSRPSAGARSRTTGKKATKHPKRGAPRSTRLNGKRSVSHPTPLDRARTYVKMAAAVLESGGRILIGLARG